MIGALDKVGRIVIPILVLVDVVSAFVDIVAGFRSSSHGLNDRDHVPWNSCPDRWA
jgi:hypothetical protein